MAAAQCIAVCPLASRAEMTAPLFRRVCRHSTWSAIAQYISAVRPFSPTSSTSPRQTHARVTSPSPPSLSHIFPVSPKVSPYRHCKPPREEDSATPIRQALLPPRLSRLARKKTSSVRLPASTATRLTSMFRLRGVRFI